MNKIFLIADTHFGHTKILEFEKEHRPFSSIQEHNEKLIDNWNSVVKPKDTVWHLGDVAFGEDNLHLCGKLNGYKHLVLGNHDQQDLDVYKLYFNKIVGAYKLAGCVLTHIPIHPSQKYRFKANIHGHTHSSKIDDPWYINVSCEQINLTPKLLTDILNE